MSFLARALGLLALLGLAAALAVSSAAFAAKPESAVELLRKGDQARKEMKNGLAMDYFNKAVQLYPTNADVYHTRADLYKELGEIDKAIADEDRACRLEPHCVPYLEKRASLYCLSGRLEEGIKACNILINNEKQASDSIYRMRAVSFKRLRRYEEAAKAFALAAEAHKNSRDYHMNLYDAGDMYLLAGKAEIALSYFERVIKACPDLSTGYWGRAKALEKLGRNREAERDREKAKHLDLSY
ncbi:MAG: tetratricopeptide repeat protein [Candidatus Obscuribacterales bacterium]|nr:tetratricopeptide repeat protein [Candidatus Obscuribacterales bacterium]